MIHDTYTGPSKTRLAELRQKFPHKFCEPGGFKNAGPFWGQAFSAISKDLVAKNAPCTKEEES